MTSQAYTLNLLYWREVGCNDLQITIEMKPENDLITNNKQDLKLHT